VKRDENLGPQDLARLVRGVAKSMPRKPGPKYLEQRRQRMKRQAEELVAADRRRETWK